MAIMATPTPDKKDSGTVEADGATGLFFNPAKMQPPSEARIFTLTIQEPKDGRLSTTNIFLTPGLNVVSDEARSLAEQHHGEYFKAGVVTAAPLGKTVGKGKTAQLESLSSLTDENHAVMTVAYERNRTTLQRWLETESRPDVARAINQRLTSLENGSKL